MMNNIFENVTLTSAVSEAILLNQFTYTIADALSQGPLSQTGSYSEIHTMQSYVIANPLDSTLNPTWGGWFVRVQNFGT